jgi:hypothetical protein
MYSIHVRALYQKQLVDLTIIGFTVCFLRKFVDVTLALNYVTLKVLIFLLTLLLISDHLIDQKLFYLNMLNSINQYIIQYIQSKC